ncbi:MULTISPECIES: tRNA(Met) cytidine acetyltransferase TmcA [Thiorhodovibrio]|uniref:tRNA(Met) cytidine acetyltransferase TmcA n=1 Tax=Thiorhodovibrio TaxID=61593 RepID=UPI001911B07B|nr:MULTISPECIES: GNAT family N-acetyltransferase [Thiorhodovibrio]MBK5967953.1 hypothetical protein [Thiorhodovibrio winogradskyi]WPL11768.1 tRNA(Met) cytidine acetyltransferase TmcA [Thiorhodovibrio litoralis]
MRERPKQRPTSVPARHRARRLLLVEGSPHETHRVAQALLRELGQDLPAPASVPWIGRGPSDSSSLVNQAEQLLGSECDLIVYDLFAGFDPDALAAASGALRGGGLLILLCPPLDQWPDFIDPAATRVATHPYRAEDVGQRFLARMALQLAGAAATLRLSAPTQVDVMAEVGTLRLSAPVPVDGMTQLPREQSGTPVSRLITTGDDPVFRPALRGALHPNAPTRMHPKLQSAAPDHWLLTDEQLQVLAAIRALITDTNPRPLVVSAGRGRGKSTALGLAAGELCQHAAHPVLITAPRYRAARTLLEHARGKAGSAMESMLRFLPPDAIVRERPAAELLLVDEAAGIPAPLLHDLLERYPRIVFATTTQGYEGTGCGFALRFFPLLDEQRPGWRHLELRQPVRFAAGDPLEALIDRLLLLDAEPATAEQVKSSIGPPPRIARIDRDQLIAQEDQLRQLFGLLRLAHYQTRPSDLRHLLDGPNLSLTALHRGNSDTLLATALSAREGTLDDALSAAIFAGERRPRGHLLPQTLSAHAGLAEAPRLSYSRIVRIAVHPAAQRQGLGRHLLEHLVQQAAADGCDLIGASFGATAELLAFWHACGFMPVQLGSHRNAATGAHAAVVLRALTPPGQTLLTQARVQFAERLLHLLPGRLNALEPALVLALLRESAQQRLPGETTPAEFPASLPASIQAELHAFANQKRTIEAALPVLARLAPQPLGDAISRSTLSQRQAESFIAAVLQQHPPENIAQQNGYSGRAALITDLRKTAASLALMVQRHPESA